MTSSNDPAGIVRKAQVITRRLRHWPSFHDGEVMDCAHVRDERTRDSGHRWTDPSASSKLHPSDSYMELAHIQRGDRRHRRIVVHRFSVVSVFVSFLCACHRQEPATEPKPLTSGIELAHFDRSVRPQDDFYRYVNGGWLKTTQIPSDRAEFGSFSALAEESQKRIRSIVEENAGQSSQSQDPGQQKIGDLFKSFMDEKKRNDLGLRPIEHELARVDALTSKDEIAPLMAHLEATHVRTPISIYIAQDDKDPQHYIAYLGQSGLSLPDRDYYLLDEERFRQIRRAFSKHLEKMLTMMGDLSASQDSTSILELETALARKHWTRVDSRDSDKVYNRFEIGKLKTISAELNWEAFLKEAGISIPAVIVSQPSALAGFGEQLRETSLSIWKIYFKWQIVSEFAQYLSNPFVDEGFEFSGRTLRGIQEQRPRWKRAVAMEEWALGELLGKVYVARHFSPDAKVRMEQLVENLLKAYKQSIESLDWLGPETKKQALIKLSNFSAKIGFPKKWLDYSGLSISPDDLVGNVLRAKQFRFQDDVNKLKKPIDRDEWEMTPQTVNAYYNPNLNEIVFPAAILQPPFFDLSADDAVNYGGIGAVIGHEIGHGFDDEGSKYDSDGALNNWWTQQDRQAFEARTKALIEQYNRFEPLKGYKVNGALTIGENIGDLGGATIAYKAYHLALNGKEPPLMDGFTGDQRFFIGFAQIWRSRAREEAQVERLKTDPHSPNEFRTRGPLQNLTEFYSAFNVTPSDRMFLPPEQRVKLW
jgi:predicted metalloendopeptidase